MEKDIVEEIVRECNWWEKVFVRLFSKTFVKTYNKARIDIINALIK